SNARPTARRRSRTRASSRKPCANKAGMSSSKAWDNSALALWMASRYLGSMATSPGNGGEGRDGFYLKRRCHDSGRKKSTYQRSLITPDRGLRAEYRGSCSLCACKQGRGPRERLWCICRGCLPPFGHSSLCDTSRVHTSADVAPWCLTVPPTL